MSMIRIIGAMIITMLMWSCQSQPQPVLALATKLRITTTQLGAAALNMTYSQRVTVDGGKRPYKCSIIKGVLPKGISLSAVNTTVNGYCLLSGAAQQTGSFPFTLKVTDSGGKTTALISN